jgi:hypothetical protein
VTRIENREVAMITAHNPFGEVTIDMYRSRFSFIYGWYMNCQTWSEIRKNIFSIKAPSTFRDTRNPRKLREGIFWWGTYARARIGLHDTWDSLFYREFSSLGYQCLIPPINLVQNLGFGAGATHTTNSQGTILLENGRELARKINSSRELDDIIANSFFGIRSRHAITPFARVIGDLIRVRKLPNFEKQLKESEETITVLEKSPL